MLVTALLAASLSGCFGDAESTSPELSFSALEPEPGAINYAITLRNRSEEPLRELEVALTVPIGMEAEAVLSIPEGAALAELEPRRTVWTLGELGPHRQVGPFACRAAMIDPSSPGSARAVVRWSFPSDGEVAAELTGWESVASGTVMQVIPPHGPSRLTDIEGSGIRYHASPDLGGASLFVRVRSTETLRGLPGEDNAIWVAAAELLTVGATPEGYVVVVLPGSLPLPPYSFADVWIEQGENWERACGPAQVTPDGQHLVIAPRRTGLIAISASRGAVDNPASMRLPEESDVLAPWGDLTITATRDVNPASGAEAQSGAELPRCGTPFCLIRDESAEPQPLDVELPGIFRSQPADSTLFLISPAGMPDAATCPDARVENVAVGWSTGTGPDGELALILAVAGAEPSFGAGPQASVTPVEAQSTAEPLDFTWRILAAHRVDDGWMARVRIEPDGGTGFYTCIGPDGFPCGLEAEGYFIDVESPSVCEPWIGSVSLISGTERVDRTLQIDPGLCPR